MADLVWSDPDPDKEEFAISARYIIISFLIYDILIIGIEVPGIHLVVRL